MVKTGAESSVSDLARAAKQASRVVARASASQREAALSEVTNGLRAAAADILSANQADLVAGREAGLTSALLDRLTLNPTRLAAMADAVVHVAGLPDPLGEISDSRILQNGLRVGKMRIPLGVILMIYESRPNVTTDAFSLCLRSGNAVILRGGKEAAHTNSALAQVVSAGVERAGLPAATCQLVGSADRGEFQELLEQRDFIDLVIPRGGTGLIDFVTQHSRIPMIQHYKGVCHVVVDRAADLDMALDICENAKVSRPGVCNACETILVHQDVADAFLPRLGALFGGHNVEIRGDATVTRLIPGARPATDADWGTEYLDLIVSVRVVPSLQAAMAHIETYGSNHTEAIVTQDLAASEAFIQGIQSSTVVVNASTRFADGGSLGLGAEIGISTSKLHAYGPMGARELTTTKFVVQGSGQVRT